LKKVFALPHSHTDDSLQYWEYLSNHNHLCLCFSACSSSNASITACTMLNSSDVCNSTTIGNQTIETTYNCPNSSRPIITRTSVNCIPTCPGKSKSLFWYGFEYKMYILITFIVTKIQFNDTPSVNNLNMRISPVPLPFPYQYTDVSTTHKILWVTFFFF
jgi:hypothetical protein